MNTQLIVYEELKKGRILTHDDVRELLHISQPHACDIFNKVAKLEGVKVSYSEVVNKNGRHYLLKTMRL